MNSDLYDAIESVLAADGSCNCDRAALRRLWLRDRASLGVAGRAAETGLDVERLADALRATGALWSANDYYEVTTDADEFAVAIAREYDALSKEEK